jgi:iron complex outermembrane receptor protein
LAGEPNYREDLVKLYFLKFIALCLLSLTALASGAQGPSDQNALNGTVTDVSGAVIAGARIELENLASGAIRVLITGKDGHYAFVGLSEGQYQITVAAQGFQNFERTGLVIHGESDVTEDLRLEVASRQDTVTVVGMSGYTTPEIASVSKINTPISQIPIAIQVVPSGVIQDQLALRLPDITRNVSGVQTNFGYGALYEAFALRGFETNVTLRNGERVSGGVGRSSVDISNVENVEVLKGPSAMIYGRLEPGGMINVVTKRPLEGSRYSLQQDFGSYNLLRTIADATGPIRQDRSLLYRTIFSFFDADQFIIHAPHGRTEFLAPSLTWRPSDRLVLNANFEYRNMDPLTANGIPAIGNRRANVPITLYLGGDVGDKANVRRELLDVNGSYQIRRDWSLRGSVAITFDDIDFEQFFGGSLDENPGPTFGDFANIPWFDKRRSKGGNAVLDLNGQFRTVGINHNVLAGTDYYQLDFSDRGFVNGWAPVDAMNIFRPVFRRSTAYGAHAALLGTPPDWTSVGNMAWHGLYGQDQIAFLKKFRLLAGGRYDWTSIKSGSITLEYAAPGSTLNDVQKTTARPQKFSPLVGLMYQPASWISLYGNYASSLGTWGTSNVIAVDVQGHPLPAEQSHSYEAGLKLQAFEGRLRSTVAAYELTKTHVATRDLSSPDPTAVRAVGEAQSSGVEVDLDGTISPRLSLIGTYAFTDAKFNKDNNGLEDNLIANVPRHSGSLWVKSELMKQKLALGTGAFARGQRQGDNENTLQLPAYVTVDVFASYSINFEHGRLVPQVNMTNLLDKRYFLNTNVYDAYPRLGIMPGQPFAVTGSIRWEY